jgi:hypothetical protein
MQNNTIGEAVSLLIQQHGQFKSYLEKEINAPQGYLGKVERGEKELSLLMAIRLLDIFELSLDEFVSLLSPEELQRKDLTTLKWMEKNRKRMAENQLNTT